MLRLFFNIIIRLFFSIIIRLFINNYLVILFFNVHQFDGSDASAFPLVPVNTLIPILLLSIIDLELVSMWVIDEAPCCASKPSLGVIIQSEVLQLFVSFLVELFIR